MTLDEMARILTRLTDRINELESLVQRQYEELDSRIDHFGYDILDVERDIRYLEDRVDDNEDEIRNHEH